MMKVYEYNDYDHYVKEQIDGNKKKITRQFNGQNRIRWIHNHFPIASNIICHGTRSGGEQKEFLKYYPEAYVIGTEISDTAKDYEFTVQHDFAVQKEEWVNNFDIVYSNSIDHSFDPDKTITTWKDQLTSNGKLFVEWNIEHNLKSTPMDPFSGSVQEFENFLKEHGLIIEATSKYSKWITYACRK